MDNWLSKILPPKHHQKNTDAKHQVYNGSQSSNAGKKIVWCNCLNCKKIIYIEDLKQNLYICDKCSYYHNIPARERLSLLFDNSIYEDIATNIQSQNFLGFIDEKAYDERIQDSIEKTNENEAIIVGYGSLCGLSAVIASFEFGFIGGSMGSVVGERFARGIRHAVNTMSPFICITTSGGARMQEGIISLMQMAKTIASLRELTKAKLPFINIIAHPTTGGVSASFVFLADIIIAEPNALIGFAGPRIIEQTVREKLPEGFQRSEYLLNNGLIDMIIARHDLKNELARILSFFTHA